MTQEFCFSTQGSTGCSSTAAYPMDVNKCDIKQTRFSVRFEKCQVRLKQAGSGRILTAELPRDMNMLACAGNPRFLCTLKRSLRHHLWIGIGFPIPIGIGFPMLGNVQSRRMLWHELEQVTALLSPGGRCMTPTTPEWV